MSKKKPLMVGSAAVELNVKLSEDDRTIRARQSAEVWRQIEKVEFDFSETKRAIQNRLKELKSEHQRLTTAFNSGRDVVNVTADQIYDADDAQTWFVYNGEEYGHRPMTPGEFQACTQRPLIEGDDVPNLRMIER